MPTTTKGITYPASSADTRLWVHLQALAEDADGVFDDYATLASPALTGTPTAPTAAANTNTTQIATTAYVQGELADMAPLASPTLTGTPAAPTAAADTDTTQVATTAFVIGQASASTPADLGTAAVGTSKRYARADHVHNTVSAGSAAVGALKTADESVSASTTPQNDNHLAIALTSGTWVIDVEGSVSTGSGAGLKILGSYSGTTTSCSSSLTAFLAAGNYASDYQSGSSYGSIGTTADVRAFRARFWVVAGGSGTFTFQWAQNASSGTTTIYAGAIIKAVKVA